MPWNWNQDQFNKMYTLLLTVIVTGVFLYGLISGKVIPWEYLFGYLVPTVNHVIHQAVQGNILTTQIKASATNGGEKNAQQNVSV